MKITVGARDSKLSKKQLEEVLAEIQAYSPQIKFEPVFLKTIGDKDRSTSLRALNKTDFFTKEIDELQLSHGCRISIHSAKDLPDPLPRGLVIAALTKGLDSSDSLVLRNGDSLQEGSIVATSSERREEAAVALHEGLQFVDIRGTIDERLFKLDTKEVDGVIIAEAALIRLNLTHLNRIKLPGSTTPMQGRLAILVREDDHEMLHLFSKINDTYD